MLLTGFPNQYLQKQLNDLCVATPPHKRYLMENFVNTHRVVCARVGVNLTPDTDKEKAFSYETSGTVLIVITFIKDRLVNIRYEYQKVSNPSR